MRSGANALAGTESIKKWFSKHIQRLISVKIEAYKLDSRPFPQVK